MRKVALYAGAAAMAALTAGEASAGGTLGIGEAGSAWATDLTALGIVLAVAGVAVMGILLMTSVIMALTIGGTMMIGGTVMALAETIAGTLWGASLGAGGTLDGVVEERPAAAGGVRFDPTRAMAVPVALGA